MPRFMRKQGFVGAKTRRGKPRGKGNKGYVDRAVTQYPGVRTQVIRGIGSPDRLIQTLKASFTIGGSGGAVGAVSNVLHINDLSSAADALTVNGADLAMSGLYGMTRVLRMHNIKVTAANKFGSAVSCGVFATAVAATLSASTYAAILLECDRREAKIFHLGPSTSGMPIKSIGFPDIDMSSIAGPSYLLEDEYGGVTNGGAPSAPSTDLFMYFFAAPTAGGNFTASTDPVFTLICDVTLEAYSRFAS